MEYVSFEALQSKLRRLYHEEQYEKASALLAEEAENFPEYAHLLFYWQITLSARQDKAQQAVDLLEKVLVTGFWYGEGLLRQNPALENLRENPRFEELLRINTRLREADQAVRHPILTLRPEGRCRTQEDTCPLLIALHPNATTARDYLHYWQPAAQAGWIVAAPESTQAMWKGAFVWDDRTQAEETIRNHYTNLRDSYALQEGRTVIAGIGIGAETAMWLALQKSIPVQGFVALAPYGPLFQQPAELLSIIQQRGDSDLFGYVVLDAKAVEPDAEAIEIIAAQLNQAGVALEVEILPVEAKEDPALFGPALLRGLEFTAG